MRLSLKDVYLTYQACTPMAVAALAGISFTVKPGERLGIVGPVGAGKSSLLGVIAGLVPPDRGTVCHGDRELDRHRGPAPGSIGLALQSPERCLFGKTVLDDVSFAPLQAGLPRDEAHRRAEQALIATGLAPDRFAARSPFSLSTGEQRRVALAGVLAMQPQALLLDEPTAHLDPLSRRDLTSRLLTLSRQHGITMVIVSHDMDEISSFAERVVLIDDGQVAADGPARQLLSEVALLESHGLEPPAVVDLGRLLSAATGAPPSDIMDEGEAAEVLLLAARGRGAGGAA